MKSKIILVLCVLMLVLGVWLSGCSHAVAVGGRETAAALTSTQVLVFTSDFGTVDDAVAICKAVMLGVAPDLRIVDLTHQIRPFAIEDAAHYLVNVTPYFPAGTTFVTVVDPGVGSERRSIVAKTKRGQFFVNPDNGLLTFVEQRDGIEEVREIRNVEWMRQGKLSNTFHGKDIYSPVGARLARGDDWTKVGPVVSGMARLDIKVVEVSDKGATGRIFALDGAYGNLISDVYAEHLGKLGYSLGDNVPVKIGRRQLIARFGRIFSDVPVGKAVLYLDWHGRVSLAINQGNFAKQYRVTPPVEMFIPRKRAP